MLFSSFKGSMALVALNSLFFASSLWAETHYVEIHNGAFFPEVTYLYPGDQVEFINRSDAERSIEGEELVESGKKGKKERKGDPVHSSSPLTCVTALLEGFLPTPRS